MILSQQMLEKIADPDDLTSKELGGKTTALREGYAYYGRLKKTFPAHYMSFKCMLRRGTPTEYVRSPESFMKFILDIGLVPDQMIRPTIGRIDHSKGYYAGNFEWQSHRENSIEPSTRNRIKDATNINV